MLLGTRIRLLCERSVTLCHSRFVGRRLVNCQRLFSDSPPLTENIRNERFGEHTVYPKFREDEMAMLTDDLSMIPILETILKCPMKTDQWTEISRKEKERLRYIASVFETTKLPSVSRVLQATTPPRNQIILNKWKQKKTKELGEEGFSQYMNSLASDGGSFHESIEAYFNKMPVDMEGSGQWESIVNILKEVDTVHGLEISFSHPLLSYQGRIDCVAQYKNKLCVIDWKLSSAKKETLKKCYDDPYQLAAYVGAFNMSADPANQVSNAVIVKAYRDGSRADVHFMNEFVLDFYWDGWLRRLARHHLQVCNLASSTSKSSNQWKDQSDGPTSV